MSGDERGRAWQTRTVDANPFGKANDWTARMLARLTPEQLQQISEQLVEVIDEVSSERWEAAQQRAASLGDGMRPDKIRQLTRQFSRELAAAGVAVGAAAAAPAVGVVPTIAATVAELGWFTARAGDLVLTIAALHGRPAPTPDERRAWLLAVMIYGSSARNEFSSALNEASMGVSVGRDRTVPLATLQTANQLMSRVFVRRYGTRRGMISLARAVPIGVGAAIGGVANYVAIRRLARNADQLFARLPYSSIEVSSVDITGRELPAPRHPKDDTGNTIWARGGRKRSSRSSRTSRSPGSPA